MAIRFWLAGAPELEVIAAETVDIGVGGAFVRCEHPLPVGTDLKFAVDVGGNTGPMALSGQVRWVRERPPCGMGIKFEGLGVDQLLALSDFFAALGEPTA